MLARAWTRCLSHISYASASRAWPAPTVLDDPQERTVGATLPTVCAGPDAVHAVKVTLCAVRPEGSPLQTLLVLKRGTHQELK